MKFASSPRFHPQSDTSSTHVHKTSKNFMTYRFVMGPLQFQSTGQKLTVHLKNSNLAMLAFKKMTTPLKQTKTEHSFRKLTLPTTKLHMHFMLTSSPESYGHKSR